MIEEELKRARFYVHSYPSVYPNTIYYALSVPDDVYRRLATKMKLEVESKELGTKLRYDVMAKNKYMPFAQRQKDALVQCLLDDELDMPRYPAVSWIVAYLLD